MFNQSPRVRAWYAVTLLCLMAAVSYLDRYIIALLAQPISHALKVSDTQIGLLIGVGFGLLYSLVGLPLAYLLDRGNRARIVCFGVAVWSLGTVAASFAPDYTWLLLSRTTVALGEAVLTPAAVSLIADLFPPQRRTLPTSVYMAVSTLMGSGAFIVGGLAFGVATQVGSRLAIEAWRLTLIFVGIPGLILAPLWLLTVPEPRRPVLAASMGVSSRSLRAAVDYVWAYRSLYGFLLLGLGVSAVGSFSFISWTATVLIRSYDFSVGRAGFYFGTIGLAAAAAAAAAWPAASVYCTKRGRPEALILLLAFALGAGQLTMASFGHLGNAPAFLVATAVATFCFGAAYSLPVLAIQVVAPPPMRAKITALYVLCGNLIGLVLGPPLAAATATHLFSGPDAMRQSLSLLGILLAPTCAGTLLLSRKHYREAAEEQADPLRVPRVRGNPATAAAAPE
jgi:MFS family permease